MRKILLVMMMAIGLSFSSASAMEYSTTGAKVKYKDNSRAIVEFTFNNKEAEYYPEMYYIPRLSKLMKEGDFSYSESYVSLEPVHFEIGANESKLLVYDCLYPAYIEDGEYYLEMEFYDTTHSISDSILRVNLGEIKGQNYEVLHKIVEFDEEVIVVDNERYQAMAGPNATKTSSVYAELNIKVEGNQKCLLTPKIKVYKRNELGKLVSETTGKAFYLNPNEEKATLIKIPLQAEPASYLVHIELLDENSRAVSRVYEFRYVLTGPSATITYLKVKDDLTVTTGVVGPADATYLEGSEIICRVYNSDDEFIDQINQTTILDRTEKEYKFELANILSGVGDFKVEIEVQYNTVELTSKKTEISVNKLNGTASTFNDIKGTKYENAVKLLNGLGILNGYPDGTFRPQNSITRAEFTVIVDKLAKLELIENNVGFKDINGHWATQYIQTAAKNGILSGYPDETFRPDNLVTYAESLTILLNMLGYKKEVNESFFGWPDNYINKAKDIGLTRNIDVTDYYSASATRGDVAIMALNAYYKIH